MRRSRAAAPGGPVVIDGFSDLVAIGSGGFSMVYRAHELALDRAVAVKVLNTGLTSDRERRDFERECKALGQLNHPDVVTVYRPAFTTDGRPCIVMALYERNFRDHLDAAGPLPPAELLDVGIRMAVALHVAHRRGVLHRDVKPHNIFRSVYGDPALGDFGISTLAGERSHDRSTALSLAYVAPEILDDAAPSAQADVYSLAATLHHLATGRAPFDGREPSRVVNQVLHADPPPLDRPDLPPSFERALRMAMSKDPAKRPVDARAFAEVLREVQARAGHSPTTLKLDTDDRPVAPVALHDDPAGVTGVREGRMRRPPPPAPAVPPDVAGPRPSDAVAPTSGAGPSGGASASSAVGGPPPGAFGDPPAGTSGGPGLSSSGVGGSPGGSSGSASAPSSGVGGAPVGSFGGPGAPSSGVAGAPAGGAADTGRPAGGDDVQSTVVRRAPLPPPEVEPERGPSRQRVVIASVVGVVAVAVIVLAIAIAGGDSPSTSTSTTAVASIPPDTFFAPLQAPAGVTVVADATGSFTVSIPPVAGA